MPEAPSVAAVQLKTHWPAPAVAVKVAPNVGTTVSTVLPVLAPVPTCELLSVALILKVSTVPSVLVRPVFVQVQLGALPPTVAANHAPPPFIVYSQLVTVFASVTAALKSNVPSTYVAVAIFAGVTVPTDGEASVGVAEPEMPSEYAIGAPAARSESRV